MCFQALKVCKKLEGNPKMPLRYNIIMSVMCLWQKKKKITDIYFKSVSRFVVTCTMEFGDYFVKQG